MNENPYSAPDSFEEYENHRNQLTKKIPRLNRCLGILSVSVSDILIAGLLLINEGNTTLNYAAKLWFWLPGIFFLLITMAMVIINAGRYSKFDWIWFCAFIQHFAGLLIVVNSSLVD